MDTFRLRGDEDYIKIGQLIKACNMVSSGAEAKQVIGEGMVFLNDEVCLQRGKKIREGDIVEYNNIKIKVIS